MPSFEFRPNYEAMFFKVNKVEQKLFSPNGGLFYLPKAIHSFRGWNRALLDFAGGIHCRESSRSIAERYQALPKIQFIYLDTLNDCRFTYKIVLSFDRKTIKPEDVKYYQVRKICSLSCLTHLITFESQIPRTHF